MYLEYLLRRQLRYEPPKDPATNCPRRNGKTYTNPDDDDKPCVIMTDRAGWDCRTYNQAAIPFAPEPLWIMKYYTALHESYCHLFPDTQDHTSPPHNIGVCNSATDIGDLCCNGEGEYGFDICMVGPCIGRCLTSGGLIFGPCKTYIPESLLNAGGVKKQTCSN